MGDAPPSIDLTNLFSTSNMPSASAELNAISPLYYPTSAGPVVPSTSPIYPLTVPAPGMTPQSALQTAAQTLTSLLVPKPQVAVAQPAVAGAGISSFLAQSSGVGGLSNEVLIGGALGIGILIMLLGRRK
jgi:hypothetical protein